MMKIHMDLGGRKQVYSLFFFVLLTIGVFCGALYVTFFPQPLAAADSLFFAGVFSGEKGDVPLAVSAFLFDALLYLWAVFLFGMTFMGLAVIPFTVALKGFVLGASLSALLALRGMEVFLQSFMTYLPAAAFCVCFFLIFCGRAFPASLAALRQLRGREAQPFLRKYCADFLPALLLTLAASGVYGALVFLANLLF